MGPLRRHTLNPDGVRRASTATTGGSDAPLSPQEVADHLRVDVRTVYDLLKRGALKGFRISRLWRINRAALKEFEECPPSLPEVHTSTREGSPPGPGSTPTSDATTGAPSTRRTRRKPIAASPRSSSVLDPRAALGLKPRKRPS
jgi:excisionase family DNA binding protein